MQDFKSCLDEFEEDLEYEEIKLTFLGNMSNKDMKVLIVELVKSDMVEDLKKQLQYQIDDEVNRI